MRVSFAKRVTDISNPVPAPEAWYTAEVYKEPEITVNRAMQDDPSDPKAGHNLVVPVKLRSIDPAIDGRALRIYLPYPKEADMEEYDAIGQVLYDSKMNRIVGLAEAFGGEIGEEDVVIPIGSRGKVYVTLDMKSDPPRNGIDIFSGFLPDSKEDDEVF